MSFVYCSYCGQRGHNRLGCPQRKAEARANPDGYLAKQIAREQERRKRAVESRTCSYCGKPGHNRRGCQVLKDDKKLIMARQKEYVGQFLESCRISGFGPGSLVKLNLGSNRETPYEKHVVALVMGFQWDDIDFLNSDYNKSNTWGVRNRSLAFARVVGSHGFSEEDSWTSPPAQNSVIQLKHEQLSDVLSILSSVDHNKSTYAMEVVGPAHGAFKVPDPILTRTINNTFQLIPAKNAKDWEKRRRSLANEEWIKVRPAEHQQALSKLEKN